MITEVMNEKLGNWERTNGKALYAFLDGNKDAPIRTRIYALCYGVRHDLVATLATVASAFEDGALLVANVAGGALRLLASVFGRKVCVDYSFHDAWSSVANVLASTSRAAIAVGLLLPNLVIHSCFRIEDPYYTPYHVSFSDSSGLNPEIPSPAPSKMVPSSTPTKTPRKP